ncbi:MAG: hypothetical protein ACJA2M_001620 [Polaribacter sp.]|jgi:hypothetical protein
MKLREFKIPLIICLIFLITSPIGQMIFGYAGGYLSYLVSEILPNSAHDVSTELMLILSLISLIGFFYSKEKIGLIISSFLSVFFLCNLVLFFSIEYRKLPEYFYPDKYIIGTIISIIILGILTILKNKRQSPILE